MAGEDNTGVSAPLFLLHRDIGELQGRMKAVENRIQQNENSHQEAFKSINEKLDQINVTVSQIRVDDASDRGRFKGGVSVIGALMNAGCGLVGGGIAALITWLTHH